MVKSPITPRSIVSHAPGAPKAPKKAARVPHVYSNQSLRRELFPAEEKLTFRVRRQSQRLIIKASKEKMIAAASNRLIDTVIELMKRQIAHSQEILDDLKFSILVEEFDTEAEKLGSEIARLGEEIDKELKWF